MTKEILIGNEPRTFADKKGALKAGRRDAGKLSPDAFITEIKPASHGDRFGIRVTLDNHEDDGIDVSCLDGFVVVYEGAKPAKVAEVPVEDVTTTEIEPHTPVEEPATPKPARKARVKGLTNVAPHDQLYPARAGTKQQAMIEMLASGASMGDLRRVCVKRDGQPWSDSSIRSALYYDVNQKGYGISTALKNGADLWMNCSFDDPENEFMVTYLAKAAEKVTGNTDSHPDEYSGEQIAAILTAAREMGWDPEDDQHPVMTLVLPEGYEEPLPAQQPKSASKAKED